MRYVKRNALFVPYAAFALSRRSLPVVYGWLGKPLRAAGLSDRLCFHWSGVEASAALPSSVCPASSAALSAVCAVGRGTPWDTRLSALAGGSVGDCGIVSPSDLAAPWSPLAFPP